MTKVGDRKLKNELSRYLARVRNGEVLTVTQRGREVALLSPAPTATIPRELTEMVSAGLAAWGGGKPLGGTPPVPVGGKQVSSLIIEDRR
jgi:prevent-host-death family protein